MSETWWVGDDQLNDEQKEIIALPLKGNHLVVGPPGSGKTNLLLLRANYIYLAGKANILVIVFTRTLKEFIASGGQEYAFPEDKITTHIKWGRDLLFQYGMRTEPPADFGEAREFIRSEIEALVQKKHIDKLYDVILLDEAHDFTPEEIKLFARLGKAILPLRMGDKRFTRAQRAWKPLNRSSKRRTDLPTTIETAGRSANSQMLSQRTQLTTCPCSQRPTTTRKRNRAPPNTISAQTFENKRKE